MTEHAPATHDLLAQLIRFDTSNPPGNESACIDYIEEILRDAGASTTKVAKDPARPNLIARVPGRGEAPPLLLYGHVDVVRADPRRWTYPPFDGAIHDGWVWGRGALDMKGGVAMMVTAILRAINLGVKPAGDVILLCLADEEAGGRYGARFIVEEHPDELADVRHAIGEFGGVPLSIAGRRFYAIQVAEKKPCWMEATIRGRAGHGAKPMRGGAMAKLGAVLSALDRARLPIHVTPVGRAMIEAVAAHLPWPRGALLRLLLVPRLTGLILSRLGAPGRDLEALFRNTVNATIVRGGEKANVIPNEITLGLDARILPGLDVDDLLDELRPVLGSDADLDVLLYDPASFAPDYGLFDRLGRILVELDPSAVSIPLLLPGSTDARFFAEIGIQTYGFTPMNLPEGFDFFSTIHGADERVPIDALEFGTKAILRLIETYDGPASKGELEVRVEE